MPIPFSLPLIDDDVVAEVNDALTGTGWLTTGPKVRQLEAEISGITGTPVLCVNSWTSGAMLMLHWFGVGPGDEVIIPAYTYSATALCAMNLGATVVMVDVDDDFTVSADNIRAAITPRTKAVIPVDMAGWPADYDAIKAVLAEPAVVAQFSASTERQAKLGRILLISDAAHSIGSTYKGEPNGQQADAAIFSLHSVKNITTGEGGAICVNLPAPFDNDAEYLFLRAFALNGQTKSAFEKNQPGAWRYDIIDQGMKVNMPDIGAAIGLAQIRKYESTLLPDRKRIFARYQDGFAGREWAALPVSKNAERESSCHLYMLRIAGADETARDAIIQAIADRGVGVNVHYIPMAMLTLFRNRGFDIADYPKTYELYSNEITLPLYNGLTDEQVDEVIRVVIESVEQVL
ncbi:dTDP-4-amino-4,6-dideoxygalactose transaminase [Salinibacterium sp. CAN_S4]|uniref:DegT/DnrJ/EryC1/StrS family aminotransferase n=1 Tax=Salinibacterium sp. CAN_S4 TaxID=2787727 RepID=UPI0018EF8D60